MEFHASCPHQSLEYWENVLEGRSSWESSLGALEVSEIYFNGWSIINPKGVVSIRVIYFVYVIVSVTSCVYVIVSVLTHVSSMTASCKVLFGLN